MLYSKLFGKTTKSISSQFESKNHELLIKAGFINQVATGLYNILPLGKKVLSKIENIIRQEMNNIGGQEIEMPLLHPKTLWEQTKRWKTVDVLFKTKSQYGQEYGLAPTHEEIVTPLVKRFINSYRDLPLAVYNIGKKFRDEPRPKSGILRGKEFGMKDLYSFHQTKKDLKRFYKTVTHSYLKIFKRCGLSDVKVTQASGGDFTKQYSHEFNIITPAGEVNLIYCPNCHFCQNDELLTNKKINMCPQCSKEELKQDKAIEVGNIFDLGTRFSQAFNLQITDKNSQKFYPVMGCYGIGTTRLIGTIVEVHYDNQGIIWPQSVSPYQIHLIGLNLNEKKVKEKANKIYQIFQKNKIQTLYDDRENVSAGEKLTDSDLIGIPIRLIISKKTGDKIEYKKRKEQKTKLLKVGEILKTINNLY